MKTPVERGYDVLQQCMKNPEGIGSYIVEAIQAHEHDLVVAAEEVARETIAERDRLKEFAQFVATCSDPNYLLCKMAREVLGEEASDAAGA